MSARLPGGADSGAFRAALDALRVDGVVGLPTDTVYGLGCLAASPRGCGAIFELKGRPDAVPLPVLIDDGADAPALCADTTGRLECLAAAFWPGPLTVVGFRAPGLGFVLGGDETTIGLRCPDDPLVRALAAAAGPLAVSSANRHGEPPMTRARELSDAFGDGLLVLDGGIRNRPPSTVVSLLGPDLVVLREGAIGFAALEAAIDARS